MNTQPSPLEILRAIQKRPGMYFGRGSDRPFSQLIAFMFGVEVGAKHGQINFEAEEFNKFVAARFGRNYPDEGRSAALLLLNTIESEEEAMNQYIRLHEEFDARERESEAKI